MRERIRNLEWSDAWMTLLFLSAVSAAVLAIICITAPKNVNYYYVSDGQASTHPAYCVYAHWTWHPDEVAYCTDDAQKALAWAEQATRSIQSLDNGAIIRQR